MKIKVRNFKNRSCCGDYTLYQLSGWDKDDWLCADDFLKELIESEADYQILPKRNYLRIGGHKK